MAGFVLAFALSFVANAGVSQNDRGNAALAEVRIRIVDQDGIAVPNARIWGGFTTGASINDYALVNGFTDTNGVYVAQNKCNEFFKDDPTDARGKMGWPNRFQDALVNAAEVFNYYSSGDEVFWEFSTVPGELEGVRNISNSAYAWQKQETHKGSKDAVGTAEGGWGFNMLAYDPPLVYSAWQADLMVADGTITSTPVFNCEFVPMLSDAADLDSQMYALAKCVPALSSPMGGVQVVSDVVSENYNLNDLNRPNGWGRFNTYWQHSDMKDMSYFYVFQLYDELISKGGLR